MTIQGEMTIITIVRLICLRTYYLYMKKFGYKSILAMVIGAVASLAFAAQVFAMTPTLSLTSNGYGSMQVNVFGDANASVILDYYSGGQLMGAGVIGTTNYSGYFSGQLNPGNYAIPNGAQVLVVVNGQQSASTTWTNNGYNNGGYNNGSLSLSQTSVNLSVGQSVSITAYNTSGSLYVSTNSNSAVANATAYGNQITINAVGYGSSSLTICSTYNYNGCSTVYVTVNGGSNNQTPVSLSQSNVSLVVGQTQTVYINSLYNNNNGYYNNGQYTLSNLSSGIVSATISGNAITLYGQNAGSSTISVCSNGYNGGYNNGYYGSTTCANLYVTVTGNYGYPTNPTYPYYPPNNYYNQLTVSNSNVQVTVGNSGSVVINGGINYYNNGYNGGYTNGYYGSGNDFYIANNNSGIANATINGNNITVYGLAAGTTSVTVCQTSTNQCATINVTVIAPNYYNYGIYNGQYQYVPSQNGQYYYSYNERRWCHR